MVDQSPEGRVSVSAWLDGELPPTPTSQPFELSRPLDSDPLEDPRWYLIAVHPEQTRAGHEVGSACGPSHPGSQLLAWVAMGVGRWVAGWPVLRQLTGPDHTGRGAAAASAHTAHLTARTETAESVARSVCPYCAVGCGQKVYVSDGRVTQIEGDPDSPISRGRLCPKGSASKSLVTSPLRQTKVLYRRPFGTDWERLDLDAAMDMIADRVIEARRKGWQDVDERGLRVRRTMGIASLGGATLDNEENYLIKKLFTALGALQIENQARI